MPTTYSSVSIPTAVSPEKAALKRVQGLGNFIANMVAVAVLALVGMALTTVTTVTLTLASPIVFLALVLGLRRIDVRRRLHGYRA